MNVYFMVVVRLKLLKIEKSVIVVPRVIPLAAAFEKLMISYHEWAIDFILRSCRLVKVASTTFGASKDHFVFWATGHSLKFESFCDRQLFDSHLKVVSCVNSAEAVAWRLQCLFYSKRRKFVRTKARKEQDFIDTGKVMEVRSVNYKVEAFRCSLGHVWKHRSHFAVLVDWGWHLQSNT